MPKQTNLQLMVVLVVVGVVLGQDNQQQHDTSPEAVNRLMDLFNEVVEEVNADPDGYKSLDVLNKIKQHRNFGQAMSIIATNPMGADRQLAKTILAQVEHLMPQKSGAENVTLGRSLVQLMVVLEHRSAGSLF